MASSTQIKLLHFFIKFAAKELRLSKIPNIHFVGNEENKYNAFGHSVNSDIHVRVTERHPNDIMRTIVHELVHFKQNISGRSKSSESSREDEANTLAGRIMKKFNLSYPSSFKQLAIREETTSAVPANSMGYSSPSNPSSSIAQPENPYWIGKAKKRKRKPLREILDTTNDPSRKKINDNPVMKRLKNPTEAPEQKGSDNTVRNSINNGNKELNQNPNTQTALDNMTDNLKKQKASAKSDNVMLKHKKLMTL